MGGIQSRYTSMVARAQEEGRLDHYFAYMTLKQILFGYTPKRVYPAIRLDWASCFMAEFDRAMEAERESTPTNRYTTSVQRAAEEGRLDYYFAYMALKQILFGYTPKRVYPAIRLDWASAFIAEFDRAMEAEKQTTNPSE